MNRRTLLHGLIAAAISSAALSSAAWAQAFPNRPIKLMVPFPAGGPADLFGRHLANGMGAELGQQVVIENRTGTGGMAGVDAVAKSAPDGYTIGINGAAALAIMPVHDQQDAVRLAEGSRTAVRWWCAFPKC